MHAESPAGAWHVVAPGETLAEIAARAGVPAEDILELNGLSGPEQVTAGRLLFVLAGPPRPPEANSAASGNAATESGTPPLAVASMSVPSGAPFRWPLQRPEIGSPFGTRDGHPHEGIDLPAPAGTPVYAAGDGQVVYAGDAIRGYGNLLVVQHTGDLMTVYAHNSALLVRAGDRVTAGQRVALVGQSGRATGPHLHFEVRQGQIPRDPLPFLSKPPASPIGGPP